MPALITSTAGSKENLDEANDPMGVCVTRSAGVAAFGCGVSGCGDTAYLDVSSGRPDAPCFGSLRYLLQTTTTHSDPNHPTYFYTDPLPNGDDGPKSDGNANTKGHSNSSSNGTS